MSTKTEINSDGVVQTEAYTRKPFPVDAIQVTEENLKAVAKWCDGEVRYSTKTIGDDIETREKIKIPYVKVNVHHPLNERQTKAYAGDWVLKSDSGFKVYTERAFEKNFELAMSATAYTMEDAVDQLVDYSDEKTNFRHAGNGRFVTEAYAKANPDTTVSEKEKKA